MASFRPDVFEADPPALLGSSCTSCGRRAFPPRDVCPECGAVDAAEPVRLSRTGVVYSFTVVRQAPPGLQTPYVLAYVDLPGDEVRVMARVEADDVDIGSPVRLVARPDERAPGRVMFAFEPDTR
jgi:scaffold protein (connect acetoacetyl-CoA thiolase and HMG-CoA synthase)